MLNKQAHPAIILYGYQQITLHSLTSWHLVMMSAMMRWRSSKQSACVLWAYVCVCRRVSESVFECWLCRLADPHGWWWKAHLFCLCTWAYKDPPFVNPSIHTHPPTAASLSPCIRWDRHHIHLTPLSISSGLTGRIMLRSFHWGHFHCCSEKQHRCSILCYMIKDQPLTVQQFITRLFCYEYTHTQTHTFT